MTYNYIYPIKYRVANLDNCTNLKVSKPRKMAVESNNRANWQITPELKALANQIREKGLEVISGVERSEPLCPTHKKPGKFVRWTGAYTTRKALFSCDEGHTFYRD